MKKNTIERQAIARTADALRLLPCQYSQIDTPKSMIVKIEERMAIISDGILATFLISLVASLQKR
jgi:hypothetical protein